MNWYKSISAAGRGRKRTITDPDLIGEIVQRYQSGVPISQLSFDYGVARNTMRKVLVDNGIQLREVEDVYQGPKRDRLLNADIPDWVVQLIQSNPGKSPDWYYSKTHFPIGKIIKYLVENNIAMHPGWLRQVGQKWKDMYWQTNPAAANHQNLAPQEQASQSPQQPQPPQTP